MKKVGGGNKQPDTFSSLGTLFLFFCTWDFFMCEVLFSKN